MREPIDGYDWNIQDDPVEPYSRELMEGALQRALEWKQLQNPTLMELTGLRSQPFNQPKAAKDGWLQIGYLRTTRWRLKVFWSPEDDRVQVEREAGDQITVADAPPPPPPNPTPWTFQVVIHFAFKGLKHQVHAKVRPFPSTAHPHAEGPSLSFPVPDPPDIALDRWCEAMRWADYTLNLVHMGDDIKTATSEERKRLFTEAIWDLARVPTRRGRR